MKKVIVIGSAVIGSGIAQHEGIVHTFFKAWQYVSTIFKKLRITFRLYATVGEAYIDLIFEYMCLQSFFFLYICSSPRLRLCVFFSCKHTS